MLILAIDTSGQNVSTALLEDDQLLLEVNSRDAQPENPLKTGSGAGSDDKLPLGFSTKRSKRGSKPSRVFPPGASELLAPMLKSLMEKTSSRFENVDLIALPTGPGLFTGLRVGVVTAKALAYSTNADLIGVNSLEVLAARAAIESQWFGKNICPVVNAQRQQLFCGFYLSNEPWNVEEVAPNVILSRENWLNQLEANTVVTGDGLRPVREQLQSKAGVTIANESCWESSAGSIGRFAFAQYQLGKRDDFWKLEPVYFRPSSAEELRLSK